MMGKDKYNFLDILNSMEDGVYIVNEKYDIEFINKALEKEYGALNGKKCHEYFAERKKHCPGCRLAPVLQGKTMRHEWTSPKTGKTYDILEAPIKADDGSTAKLKILRDISHRKKQEKKSALLLRRLDTVIENAHSQVAYLDCNFNFLMVNSAYEKGAGFSRKQLIGKNHFDIFPNKENKEIFQKVIDTGQTIEFREKPFIYKNAPERGVTYWDWTLSPVKNDKGSVEGLVLSLYDVTELRNAWEKIEEDKEIIEKQYEEIKAYYDCAPVGLAALDNNLHFLRVNQRLAHINGMPIEKHIGRHIKDVVPAFQSKAEKITDRVRRTGKPVESIEFEGKMPADKKKHIFSESWYPLKNKSGKITGFSVLVEDITKSKENEQEREQIYAEIAALSLMSQKHASQLDAIFNSIANPILAFGEDKKVQGLNHTAEKLLDFDPKGMTENEFMEKLDAQPVNEKIPGGTIIQRALSGKTIRNAQCTFNITNEKKVVLASAAPIKRKEEITGAILAWHDITQRQKIEEAIKASEQRFSLVKENTQIAMIEVNAYNQIIAWNPAAQHIFGYDEAEAYGKSIMDIIIPKHKRQQERKFWHILADKAKSRHIVSNNVTKKGKELICEWFSTSLQDTKSNLTGAMFLGIDITARKKAEQITQKSLKEKEILLKEIHHRVKNNLQIITSMLNLQLGRIKDEAGSEAINNSKNRIRSMALIHEKLYQADDLANINLCSYIKELAIDLMRSYAGQSTAIRLNLDCESISTTMDRAIPCGLIINELISNSLKYAFQGREQGTITIKIRENEKNYKLIIADDGKGIEKDINVMNAESLGLQLVAAQAEQLNGRLNLNRAKRSILDGEIIPYENGKMAVSRILCKEGENTG
ncbi:PAS domain S-box protein [Candidatus Woesearchaeota archaeon]|nr:PAS domain S-box protein [Candidatus Woesearchaeota archaeon]